ncbi:MAG: selenide, water dikinase SelD [Flavobacteriales bacterium]
MNDPNEVRLTQYSRGSGCGCKISPATLREILQNTEVLPTDPRLLVGNESHDDASVFQLNGDKCLVSTTDFFMPVVDNAYQFGKIAAANALSDIYAMGGFPLTALAILGWPVDRLPASLARQVLEGARFTCRMAGITLAGGHSINSVEPIFGLAANGFVNSQNLKRNNTANAGDLLYLTKPLGFGIITTAHKRGVVREADFEAALSQMYALNKAGTALGTLPGITALTDVTGFGLIGHLIEMCDGGRLSATLNFQSIPVLSGLAYYTEQMIYPDMTMKNFAAFSASCNTLSAQQLYSLCDPQTSGGLLVAVKPDSVDEYLKIVSEFGLQGIGDKCIGEFTTNRDKTIEVV